MEGEGPTPARRVMVLGQALAATRMISAMRSEFQQRGRPDFEDVHSSTRSA